MMVYVVIIFLWVSLLIYLLMGGADYGAGILELFSSRRQKLWIRDTSYGAMGPIWEANHMWLIIAVVILFIGFPQVYATVSVYLHIPLLIMLVGIIARGTSFSYRNYDAIKDRWQPIYSKIFVYSSFITPLFLGVIAGSAVSGRIDPGAFSFFDAYVNDWLNWFCFSTGFFTVSLCGFLAAVYLTGEVEMDSDKKKYIRKAGLMNLAMLFWGSIIFIFASYDNIPLASWVFGNRIGCTAVCCSILSLAFLWITIFMGKIKGMRVSAGFMVTGLLIAVTYKHFPDIILMKNGRRLSLLDRDAPEKTIASLGSALLLGSCFILPALFYLLYSFRRKENEEISR